MAEYFVQNAAGFVCPLDCLPRLLIENVLLKSRINQAVYVRSYAGPGIKSPCLFNSTAGVNKLFLMQAYLFMAIGIAEKSPRANHLHLLQWKVYLNLVHREARQASHALRHLLNSIVCLHYLCRKTIF
jgi:hypothetical protein